MRYKHFKGDEYEFIGRADFYDTLPRGSYKKKAENIIHTELSISFTLYESKQTGKLIAAKNPIGSDNPKHLDELVIYHSVEDKYKLFGRPSKMFFGKTKLKSGKEVLRFESIPEESE